MERAVQIRISLAAARVNAGMNQKEWADFLGVDVSTVSNWENGKGEPKWKQLKAMSEASGIPMDFIFVPEQSEKIGLKGAM